MASAFVLLGATHGSAEQDQLDQDHARKLRLFVVGQYPHGVPYDAAVELGPASIPALKEYLDEPGMKQHWHRVATTIAFLGGTDEFVFLRSFVWDRFRGPVDDETYMALLAAHGGLGYVAARSKAPVVLDYLKRSSNQAFWGSLPWSYPIEPAPPNGTARTFSELSITALGISGSPTARRYLEEVRAAATVPATRQLAEHAIKVNEKVSRAGVSTYLRDASADGITSPTRGLR